MSAICLIAALGNPGVQYATSRHNAGWLVADAFASARDLRWKKSILAPAHLTEFIQAHQKVRLIKPLTFMNLSGSGLRPLMRYYKIRPDQVLVIHDDIAFEPGRVRLSFGGSAGGHNGIKSVIELLGEGFWRLRLGVGAKPANFEMSDWVLGKLADSDVAFYTGESCVGHLERILQAGPQQAQNIINRPL